jgi:hypothetical protein
MYATTLRNTCYTINEAVRLLPTEQWSVQPAAHE